MARVEVVDKPSTQTSSSAPRHETAKQTKQSLSTVTEESTRSSSPSNQHDQTATSKDEDAIIRRAFSSESTADDFLSIYGRSSRLTASVYNIGSDVDALIDARKNYLAIADNITANLLALASICPRGPVLDDIVRRLEQIDPVRNYKDTVKSKSTADRHLPTSSRPSPPATRPVATSTSGSRQSATLASSNANLTNKATPVAHRPTTGPNTTAPRQPRHRLRPCNICNRMGHRQESCRFYFCQWCNKVSPGHYARFCPSNPYQGLEGWQLPANAMEKAHPIPAYLANSAATISETAKSRYSTIQSKQSGVPTNNNTVNNNNATVRNGPERYRSTTRSTTALGPTYRPRHAPKPSHAKPIDNSNKYGKLRTTTPRRNFSRNNTGNTSDHSTASEGEYYHIPPPERFYGDTTEGDPRDVDYYEYDDVELYNIVGEGNF